MTTQSTSSPARRNLLLRMVPIVGGTFEGPGLRGRVMPGGADRQLVRRNGAIRVYRVV